MLECAGGATALGEALENVRRGGRVGVTAFYGSPIRVDMDLAVLKQIRNEAFTTVTGRSGDVLRVAIHI